MNPQFGPPIWAGLQTDEFHDGLAVVNVGSGDNSKYGYIDKQGHFVVNPQFDEAGNFSEGLAAVRIGNDKTGKYGYIARY